MAAYFIVNLTVTDAEKFKEYAGQVAPIVEQFGGRYLVRGGEQHTIEGEWPGPRTVVLEFPSMEQARAWYDSDEYKGPLALRHAASTGNMVLVEGV